jgi:hypothetical protein
MQKTGNNISTTVSEVEQFFFGVHVPTSNRMPTNMLHVNDNSNMLSHEQEGYD